MKKIDRLVRSYTIMMTIVTLAGAFFKWSDTLMLISYIIISTMVILYGIGEE